MDEQWNGLFSRFLFTQNILVFLEALLNGRICILVALFYREGSVFRRQVVYPGLGTQFFHIAVTGAVSNQFGKAYSFQAIAHGIFILITESFLC